MAIEVQTQFSVFKAPTQNFEVVRLLELNALAARVAALEGAPQQPSNWDDGVSKWDDGTSIWP
jgi:hypothetical protein